MKNSTPSPQGWLNKRCVHIVIVISPQDVKRWLPILFLPTFRRSALLQTRVDAYNYKQINNQEPKRNRSFRSISYIICLCGLVFGNSFIALSTNEMVTYLSIVYTLEIVCLHIYCPWGLRENRFLSRTLSPPKKNYSILFCSLIFRIEMYVNLYLGLEFKWSRDECNRLNLSKICWAWPTHERDLCVNYDSSRLRENKLHSFFFALTKIPHLGYHQIRNMKNKTWD